MLSSPTYPETKLSDSIVKSAFSTTLHYSQKSFTTVVRQNHGLEELAQDTRPCDLVMFEGLLWPIHIPTDCVLFVAKQYKTVVGPATPHLFVFTIVVQSNFLQILCNLNTTFTIKCSGYVTFTTLFQAHQMSISNEEQV